MRSLRNFIRILFYKNFMRWPTLLLMWIFFGALSVNILAQEIPDAVTAEPGMGFEITGENGISGRVLYSEPALGYADKKEHMAVYSWDMGLQLVWVTEKTDYTLEYRIACDGREETVYAGEIEPLYYRYRDFSASSPWQWIYEENRKADSGFFYPAVPKEYQQLRDSDKIMAVSYVLSWETAGSREQTEISRAYFYGEGMESVPPYQELIADSLQLQVREGDTLWALAQQYLGDPLRYGEIYEENRDKIRHPDRIYAGQILTVASAETGKEFSFQGEDSVGGKIRYSEPVYGYYHGLRYIRMYDWDTGFQLEWLTDQADVTLEYRIFYDGREEVLSAEEIQPLFYRHWAAEAETPRDLVYEVNPAADSSVFYPAVPEAYQWLEHSDRAVRIRYILCRERIGESERQEIYLGEGYFYGEQAGLSEQGRYGNGE